MHVFSKLIMAFAFVLAAPAFAADVHGILRVVKGDVQIKSAKSGQQVRARLGEKVFPKDVIVTGKDARAKIVMVDNNEINVSPETRIEIQNYEFDPAAGKKEVLLNVLYGKVRSKVEQKYDGKTSKFTIKTPSAVAGVRGTDFLTSYAPATNSSSIVTFEGRVEFGIPGPNGAITNAVFVAPGQQASSSGAAPPSTPAPVPKEELAKMDNDSKNETPKATGAPPGDQRQPAGDDKKKEGEKSGPSTGNSRAPSSTGGSGMIGKDDTPAGQGGGPKGNETLITVMPPPPPGPPPMVNIPGQNCDFCRENLTGQTKLLIKVNAQ